MFNLTYYVISEFVLCDFEIRYVQQRYDNYIRNVRNNFQVCYNYCDKKIKNSEMK